MATTITSNTYSLRGLRAQPPPPHSISSEAYERAQVHDVYDAIAPHFAATRHTPWPRVAAFLRAQPRGAVGLDVGCGNGKYLAVDGGNAVLLGSDRSAALARLARAAACDRADVVMADALALPFRACAADFLVCIAVLHHLSTRPRRQDAIRQLLRCAKSSSPPPSVTPLPASSADPPGSCHDVRAQPGQVLIYVWALEQASSRRGWDERGEQDRLVPWVVKANRSTRRAASAPAPAPAASAEQQEDKVFHRYYHLYRKGELEEDVCAAGGQVLHSGFERDNWWVIAVNPTSCLPRQICPFSLGPSLGPLLPHTDLG